MRERLPWRAFCNEEFKWKEDDDHDQDPSEDVEQALQVQNKVPTVIAWRVKHWLRKGNKRYRGLRISR